MVDTQVVIGSLRLKNPVLAASGTFGYGDDGLTDVNALGGIVTKSLSLEPREGNPPPRIAETPAGMLNSIGLANIGVQRFIEEKLPALRKVNTAVIANIAASSLEEYCAVLSRLDDYDRIDGYEINVSCHHVKEGGLSFGTSCEMTAEITRRLRRLTKKTLIVKLTPNVTHISEFARAVESEGADAVSVINTLIGMAIDIRTRTPRVSTVTGGLSGPAIKPIALAKVYETAQAVKIPVIGIGGIASAEDALEFLIAGATAIQVGTANFINPSTGGSISEGILRYCTERNLATVREVVGTLQASKTLSVLDSWLSE